MSTDAMAMFRMSYGFTDPFNLPPGVELNDTDPGEGMEGGSDDEVDDDGPEYFDGERD